MLDQIRIFDSIVVLYRKVAPADAGLGARAGRRRASSADPPPDGPRMARHIRITRFGGLGNRMFQYMFALALKARVPEAEISGVELPEWGITSAPLAPPQTGRAHSGGQARRSVRQARAEI